MNPRPIHVKPLNNYHLLITFQNGEKKIFDVSPLLSLPIYQPLKNKTFFQTAKADGMCVYWNDDIDLCPDMTYLESKSFDDIEEVEPDEIDLQMLKAIEEDPDCHEFTNEKDINWE